MKTPRVASVFTSVVSRIIPLAIDNHLLDNYTCIEGITFTPRYDVTIVDDTRPLKQFCWRIKFLVWFLHRSYRTGREFQGGN